MAFNDIIDGKDCVKYKIAKNQPAKLPAMRAPDERRQTRSHNYQLSLIANQRKEDEIIKPLDTQCVSSQVGPTNCEMRTLSKIGE